MNFCPYCGGKIVSPEAKFCMSCGKSLESSADIEVLPVAQGDDFFDEMNTATENPINKNSSGDDFFGELDTAGKREDAADLETIAEAEKYFLRGEFSRVENLLEDFANKGYDRANYMLAVIYETGGDGVEEDKSAALDLLLKMVNLFDKGNDLCPCISLISFWTNKSQVTNRTLKLFEETCHDLKNRAIRS